MQRLRAMGAVALSLSLGCAPLFAGGRPTTTPLGTVIAADRAHVGEAGANVGTTVYSGDRVSTDLQGSMQLRAGAARLLLQSASAAIVDDNEGAPSAKLVLGTATFSTGNAHAFTMFASKAAIRPQTDAPTIGTVTYLTDRELLVSARRGGLTITVEDETQVVAEGSSFRVVIDPEDAGAQGPEGAGSTGRDRNRGGNGPLRAGRSRFLLLATALIAAGTGVAIYKAVESPDRP
jgi:hypothetical protein